MTQKHTPEPWKLYRNDQSVGDAVGHAVCDVWPRGDDQLASAEGKGNARRIVACVNAMAGIAEDNAVFAHGNSVRQVISSMATKQADTERLAADLQAQVDELLSAAKHLLSNAMINSYGEWQGAFVEGTDITEYCQPLQDAINKITGEPK